MVTFRRLWDDGRKIAWLTVAIFLTLFASPAIAQDIYFDEGVEEKAPSKLVLPFVFPSAALDTAFGVCGAFGGRPQPQANMVWALMGSSNSSFGAYFAGLNIQMPFVERLFLDPRGTAVRYTKMRSYQEFPLTGARFSGRAGSNESDKDDFIEGKGREIVVEFRFRYLLPIGSGRNEVIHTYHMQSGLISEGFTGGQSFNPFTSGRTYLVLAPFYRNKEYDSDEDKNDTLLSSSNGLTIGLEWDNRDFVATPSRGDRFRFDVTCDFGWFDSDSSYSKLSIDYAKYFPLPITDWARQQVIAFNLWTADTPTWNVRSDGTVSGRAPEFKAPRLGGFHRMRAFPPYRYNERAVIYYSLEYRLIPAWNPLARIRWLRSWLEPDWWQTVPFLEVGRVAPEYDLGTLHEDIRWDVGLSFRFMLKKATVRVDLAFAEESNGLWVMFGQPF